MDETDATALVATESRNHRSLDIIMRSQICSQVLRNNVENSRLHLSTQSELIHSFCYTESFKTKIENSSRERNVNVTLLSYIFPSGNMWNITAGAVFAVWP